MLIVVQRITGKKLCGLPADQWSYLLAEVRRHVQLQHIIDQVRLISFAVWLIGNPLVSSNKVTLCRLQLVWVTICGEG